MEDHKRPIPYYCSQVYRACSMIGLLLNRLLTILRDKIMTIVREVDPEEVSQRRQRRLKRRVYQSKVRNLSCIYCTCQVMIVAF